MDWNKVVFLHTGWADRYDGSEAPEGGHAYLKMAVGVEAENFKPVEGWCYGYAPVGLTSEGRRLPDISKDHRTLDISKLGASRTDATIDGVLVIWTARQPKSSPTIVGLYDNATVYRYMPKERPDFRPFIAKARAEDCRLVPSADRRCEVIHKRKGFPGMAAAWFPGMHQDGPASEMLRAIAPYIAHLRARLPLGEPRFEGF